MKSLVESSFDALKSYCEKEEYKGWDPFDGLNSKIFQFSPFFHNKLTRLAWLQLFKRNPVNLRPLFLVDKGYNPKGLGLFLTGYCNLYHFTASQDTLNKIHFLANKMIELGTEGYSGACWGYNFDWQAKAFFQPKKTPTVVATTFITYALLDAYEVTAENRYLDIARSACDFIMKDLNRTFDSEGNFAFSYSPLDQTQIFNASLLGARTLSRVYSISHEEELISAAESAVRYCVKHQNEDGSWAYGTLPHHQWVDNFHTGYNLECLGEYMKFSQDNSFQQALSKGLQYYTETFFTEEGVSKYFNNKTYPVDIHAPAQLVVTLSRLNKLHENKPLVDRVLNWTITHMQDDHGYFYYRVGKRSVNKIPYIRWSQAWMFYALSFYLKEFQDEKD